MSRRIPNTNVVTHPKTGSLIGAGRVTPNTNQVTYPDGSRGYVIPNTNNVHITKKPTKK